MLSEQDRVILERRIRPLVTDELIAQHRADPLGVHEGALREVLNFVRRNPDPSRPRYLVLRAGDRFTIAERAAVPGGEHPRVGSDEHATRAEAEHAVFVLRLRDLGIAP
jgi:hypothetical protein